MNNPTSVLQQLEIPPLWLSLTSLDDDSRMSVRCRYNACHGRCSLRHVIICYTGILVVCCGIRFRFVMENISWKSAQTRIQENIFPSAAPVRNDSQTLKVGITINNESIDHSVAQNEVQYYSWGPEGIPLGPILNFIDTLYKGVNSTWYRQKDGPFPGFVSVANSSKPSMWFAKSVLKRRCPINILGRLRKILPHFQHALQVQLLDNPHRFPALHVILKRVGSFPVLMDLNDYLGCNRDNYEMFLNGSLVKQSIPLLTLSHHIQCRYAFPIPDYSVYELAVATEQRPNGSNWDDVFSEWADSFPPMANKIPKAFWRGSCTHSRPHRKQMFDLVKTNNAIKDYLDFGFTALCFGMSEGVRTTPPTESMRFRAVLDMDGNSWSERFPRLLCYNSVVIRVEIKDDYEAYFMTQVKPGIHYLPASLENFTDVAKWAVQDSSLPLISLIVKNANAWCKQKIRTHELNLDFLTILNGYIEGLNSHDGGWIDQWKHVQELYLGKEAIHLHDGFISELNANPRDAFSGLSEMKGLKVAPLFS